MRRKPEALGESEFDLVVVGAGITGACLAFDAATRGMRVALIDKGDFGGATSSASSKLLHGGLRYLQQLRFGKTRESARERLFFQNLAPHLCRYVPFVVPTYRTVAKSKSVLSAGMLLYEALCTGHSELLLDPDRAVPVGRGLSPAEVSDLVPGVNADGLTGGRLFYESHMHNSERMTLGFVHGAVVSGAAAANYVRADEFLRDGKRVVGVRATDIEGSRSVEIRARAVANAAGPWIRELNAEAGMRTAELVTGMSRGAHLVTRSLTDEHAVALPTRRRADAVVDRGGRHIFIIPWRGHSLIGTSYGPHLGSLDDLSPTADEIDDLIADVNGALGADTLVHGDVMHAFAGLYPLTADEIDPSVYQGSADYQVIDHSETEDLEGLFTVFGAKFTTARLLAEHAVDAIGARVEGDWRPCQTRSVALPSSGAGAAGNSLPEGMPRDLNDNYGGLAAEVAALAMELPDGTAPIAPERGVWGVDPVWAARSEMAVRLDDVVFRRTGLGTLGNPGEEALARVARAMGSELGWDSGRTDAEVERTTSRFPL